MYIRHAMCWKVDPCYVSESLSATTLAYFLNQINRNNERTQQMSPIDTCLSLGLAWHSSFLLLVNVFTLLLGFIVV